MSKQKDETEDTFFDYEIKSVSFLVRALQLSARYTCIHNDRLHIRLFE